MTTDRFDDKDGRPLQKGYYEDGLSNGIVIVPDQVKEAQILHGSKGDVIITPQYAKYLKRISDLKKYAEDLSKNLDFLEGLGNLEDLMRDLPPLLPSTHIFLGPQGDHRPQGKHPNLHDSGYVHPNKKGLDAAIQGPPHPPGYKEIDINSAIQGPPRLDI